VPTPLPAILYAQNATLLEAENVFMDFMTALAAPKEHILLIAKALNATV
jgi:hypothetical protein